jgi:hypothetical protein
MQAVKGTKTTLLLLLILLLFLSSQLSYLSQYAEREERIKDGGLKKKHIYKGQIVELGPKSKIGKRVPTLQIKKRVREW